MIRWYLARWEIELFFFDPQPELSTRSTTIVHDSADGAGNGVVSDCELAHWPLDVFGTYGTRFGGQPGVGRGRMAEDEWPGTYLLAKQTVPQQPPTLNTALRMIARLGGFLGRDGELGEKNLWLGLQRMMDFASGLRYAQQIGAG